jgi:hypothetical protein
VVTTNRVGLLGELAPCAEEAAQTHCTVRLLCRVVSSTISLRVVLAHFLIIKDGPDGKHVAGAATSTQNSSTVRFQNYGHQGLPPTREGVSPAAVNLEHSTLQPKNRSQ